VPGELMLIKDAAVALGMTEQGVRKAIASGRLVPLPGRPLGLTRREVRRFAGRQRADALREFLDQGGDLVELAIRTRRLLHPAAGSRLGDADLGAVPLVTRVVFGHPVMRAAALCPRPGLCRWCAACAFAEDSGAVQPRFAAPLVELLGQPCAGCSPRLGRGVMGELARRVHRGGVRPSGASRPGRLRCGHLLEAGCSCPRRASVR
jgi:hypothetical protein